VLFGLYYKLLYVCERIKKMRKLIILVLLVVLVAGLNAQTVVSGMVKDSRNNPVTGATVAIRDSYDGTTTDSLGRFSFKTSEKADQVLVVSSTGYKTAEQKINLNSPVRELSFVIKEEINEMKAVVITAGSFEAGDKKRAAVLSSIDMLTTASANADVTGAVKTLPGAQQVGETEGLFVRGGTASETKTYIDGTLVNNFFYTSVPNIAQRGRFSPWLFKGTVFSAGGYSALYGQALSSALILESLDMPERSFGSLSVSFIGGSFGIQKLSKSQKFSWGMSYGYTNVDLAFRVLKPKVDYFNMPQFHTGDANFRLKTSKNGILKYYGYFSQNHVGVRRPSLDSLGYKEAFDLKNFNMYHNLSWREFFGTGWKFNGGVSYATNKDDIKGNFEDGSNHEVQLNGLEEKNFLFNTSGHYINAKAVFEKRLNGLSALRFGAEDNFSNDKADYTRYTGLIYRYPLKENILAGFGEADLYVTNDLAAKFGARVEHSALLKKFNLAPRVSLAYKLAKQSQVSFAYGIFYQNPDRKYLPAENDLDFTKATHYILQYQKTTAQQTFRAEVYYKKYEDLIKTSLNNNRESAVSNNGYGYAKGFELFYRDRKTFKNFDYWISYSYLDTKRDFLNYPTAIQPAFAAKHTANLVVKKFVPSLKTQFNANYVFATGRPYYNIRYDNNNSKFNIYDQGKTIPYNSLSFSMNYLPNVYKNGAGKYTVFVFSVTNVLGSRQVFGYDYSQNGLHKQAIIPPTKIFVYLGAFINFGIDRTQDVINNNL
jgi:vitamin B12 transporter